MKGLFYISFMASAFIFLTSCKTGDIATDYDRAYNFGNVKTYNYYTDNSIQLNQIDSVNFMNSLNSVLQSKGLVRSKDNPDVYVAVKVFNGAGTKRNDMRIGIGGGGRFFGLGTSVGIPIESKVMNYAIQVDFDDAKTKHLIWTTKTQKTTSYNASSNAKTSFYNATLSSMFKDYPLNSRKNQAVKSNYYN